MASSHTVVPGALSPSMAPGLAQCAVTSRPSSRLTSARNRLYRRTSVPRIRGLAKRIAEDWTDGRDEDKADPMPNPTAAMLTIGDEILSGRTRDSNMPHLAQALAARGIRLRETRVVPDDHAEIVAALNALRARYTHVFTSGGIGPTHDDITADAVAAAFGVGIDVREDARAILAQNYANPEVELNPARLRMARIPDGAELIENPVSRAPGLLPRQRARDGRRARGLRGDGRGRSCRG